MTFDEFDIDIASGELRRHGERVKIQDLPFRVLTTLLARRGEVVTREELRSALWGAETFVDAEAGLNTAIAKLREALGEKAEAPRFIETLPKRGYRFRHDETAPADAGHAIAETAEPEQPRRASWLRRPLAWVTCAVLLITAGVIWRQWAANRPTTIAVVLFHNETGDASFDQLAQQLTDGTVVALAADPHYAVIGNAAILRTPRIFADIKVIGETLRARYLVLGQVQHTASGVIVRTHFIRVSDQKHLWAKGIEGDLAGLDTLVPQTVADAVDAALRGAPK